MGAICVCHALRACFSGSRHGEKTGQCHGQNHFDFAVDHCLFLHWLLGRLWRQFQWRVVKSGGGETETFGQGLTLIKFFFVDLCRRYSSHYFRRHRRACRFVPYRFGCYCCGGVSVFRRHDLERQWFSGVARRKFRCRFHDWQARLLSMASRPGWLWRPSLCWAHEPAVTAIAERRSRLDPVAGIGQLAFMHWLVRLMWSAHNRWRAFPVWSRSIPDGLVGGILAALIVGRADPRFVHTVPSPVLYVRA